MSEENIQEPICKTCRWCKGFDIEAFNLEKGWIHAHHLGCQLSVSPHYKHEVQEGDTCKEWESKDAFCKACSPEGIVREIYGPRVADGPYPVALNIQMSDGKIVRYEKSENQNLTDRYAT